MSRTPDQIGHGRLLIRCSHLHDFSVASVVHRSANGRAPEPGVQIAPCVGAETRTCLCGVDKRCERNKTRYVAMSPAVSSSLTRCAARTLTARPLSKSPRGASTSFVYKTCFISDTPYSLQDAHGLLGQMTGVAGSGREKNAGLRFCAQSLAARLAGGACPDVIPRKVTAEALTVPQKFRLRFATGVRGSWGGGKKLINHQSSRGLPESHRKAQTRARPPRIWDL